MHDKLWQFWIDVGGTFTDCIGRAPDSTLHTRKVLSSGVVKGHVGEVLDGCRVVHASRFVEPDGFFVGYRFALPAIDETNNPAFESEVKASDGDTLTLADPMPADAIGRPFELTAGEPAPVLGIRSMLGIPLGESIDDAVRPPSQIDDSSATPQASPFCRVRLGTTRGTNALLERKGARVALITTRGFGDLSTIGTQARPNLFELDIRKPPPLADRVIEIDERIAADGTVLTPIDRTEIERALLATRDDGIDSVAVCLLNAYANAEHEHAVRDIADSLGFSQVSVSTDLAPAIKMLDRCDTAVVDAYLSPVIRDYVRRISTAMPRASLKLMTSSGGLVDADHFAGKDSILSGPAGGVVGFAGAAKEAGFDKGIGFDMGGTSTDVSRFDGEYDYQFTSEKAGVRIVAPMYAIETVAAGGGSICDFDGQRLTVGPHSAGADPGPACYGKGGPLTVTDINLFCGKLDASQFPFSLDVDAVRGKLKAIAEQMQSSTDAPAATSLEEIADGFTRIANDKMAGAIQSVSAAKGYDPKQYPLIAFGGAAGQHACAIAELLGIDTVVIHPFASILSAYGAGLADVRRFAERSVLQPLNDATRAMIADESNTLGQQLTAQVRAEGVPDDRIRCELLLDLRYAGEASAITVREPADGDCAAAFHAMHEQLYGHAHRERDIELVTLRLEAIGRSLTTTRPTLERNPSSSDTDRPTRDVIFHGETCPTHIFARDTLNAGDDIIGPAIITEALSTTVIDPGWRATVADNGDLRIQRTTTTAATPTVPDDQATRCDPIRLELFNNQFTQIATQMGITLQRTSLSVNVKERLDFSCAIIDGSANLVVNAPHIPVHLGAMSATVEALRDDVADMRPGDVYATNDPDRGGSHLPDITVITPLFDDAGEAIRFFTASRAHHAEIGGLRPGSAFPFAKNLAEEGVVLKSVLIQRDGVFREAELRALLTGGPYPSRAPDENIADIRAAIAANHKGATALNEMIAVHSWPVVDAYMGHIRRAACDKATDWAKRWPAGEYRFEDTFDDGETIGVTIAINNGLIDLAFTAPRQRPTSLNANPAIVDAAVLYCLRCLIDEDIPLNSGVLSSVRIDLPNDSMLKPYPHRDPQQHVAVVGGNVEVSQRLVDIIFGALGVVAASQGTMNNFVFGNERFGYYETICGGAGAGPAFDGASAVHTHMTNTRLTDPEIMERHYPVRVLRFAIRRGSGGAGKHRGGDGVVREVEFLEAVEVSLLTQRRTRGPFGLNGGEDGQPGRNTLIRAYGSKETLAGMAQFDAATGDRLFIETPGGGGYGKAER